MTQIRFRRKLSREEKLQEAAWRGLISCVYAIECLATGHVYVGRTVHLGTRWYQHRKALNLCKHHCYHLQVEWDLFGGEAFHAIVLEVCEQQYAFDLEAKWMSKFIDEDRLYEQTQFPEKKLIPIRLWEPEPEDDYDPNVWSDLE